ncbi:GNAT family N-acetyltransferase [Candidatus Roizmanbacteria bacterium]|nr:GNAT family N-acetyltransferase [Candidatus Roizmanbacteria bacterium]
MQIRPAQASDYESLMYLYNLFVDSDRYSKLDNDSFSKVLESKSNFVYVAKENDVMVGFASFSVRWVVRYPKLIAELDELFVMEEYRKSKIGYLLMRQVEEKAKELDCYRLYIESHYSHKAAHALYEKMGYINYGYHFMKNI